MSKRLFVIILFLNTTIITNAQLFDNYGLNIGTSYSNQTWKTDNVYNIYSTQKNEYTLVLTLFLSFEKKLNKVISFKPEIGFIQKGFQNDFKNYDTISSITKGIIRLNDLGLNLRFKFKPLQLPWSPYIYIGNRFAYLISINYIKNTYNYNNYMRNMNKPSLARIIGLGIERKDWLYFELEYNRCLFFSKLPGSYYDNIWSLKLGININKIPKKNNTK